MKAVEMRQKSDGELYDLLAETQSLHFKLRMQHCTGQLDKVSELGRLRRTIAQVKTLLRERARSVR